MQLFLPLDNSGILPIAYFHALAHIQQEGLILIEPAQTFVSLGFFDNTATTLDQRYCTEQGIPVMRRETGGGMVLLGPQQVFYTLVIKRPHAPIPARVDDAYQHLSQGPIAVYRAFGIETTLRPVSDIITGVGRKISGQGAGDINGYFCFVGSILVDFDCELMHRIVKLPDEALRPPLKAALIEHMTSLYRETGRRPSTEDVKHRLAQAFAPLVGGLTETPVSTDFMTATRAAALELSAPEHLWSEETRQDPLFKVREGLYLCQRVLRHEGERILLSLTICDGYVQSARIEGPELSATEGLNLNQLVGLSFQPDVIQARLLTAKIPGINTDQLIALLFGPRS